MRGLVFLPVALAACALLLTHCKSLAPPKAQSQARAHVQSRAASQEAVQINVRILATPQPKRPQPQNRLPIAATSTAIIMAKATDVGLDMKPTDTLDQQPNRLEDSQLDHHLTDEGVVTTPTTMSVERPYPIDSEPLTPNDLNTSLLSLHNQARAAAGLPEYRESQALQRAAQQQADYLATKPAGTLMSLGIAGHRDANGNLASVRAVQCGYVGTQVSENWAYFGTTEAAFDYWLTDQWHRPQVMSSVYTEVGFGIRTHPSFGTVFVAVYGTAP